MDGLDEQDRCKSDVGGVEDKDYIQGQAGCAKENGWMGGSYVMVALRKVFRSSQPLGYYQVRLGKVVR